MKNGVQKITDENGVYVENPYPPPQDGGGGTGSLLA